MKGIEPFRQGGATGASGRRLRPAVFLQAIVVLLLCGCSGTVSRTVEEMPLAPQVVEAKGRYLKQYVLMEGDKIEISVWQVPEYSRIVEIRPDGKISLPTVSNVDAAGLTFEELEADLRKRLAERLRDPIVTVIAVDVRDASVFVLGDVGSQRAVPLRDAPTALQAIAMAGGLLRSAEASDVSIIRLGDDGVLRAIPIGAVLEESPNPYMTLTATTLQADDIVFVPESRRSTTVRWLDDFVARPLSYLASSLLSYRILNDDLY